MVNKKSKISEKARYTLGIFKKITGQHTSLFSVIRRQSVYLIANYEANILPCLTPNIHRIMDLLFSFICLIEKLLKERSMEEVACTK
jgi:hypothetical protein